EADLAALGERADEVDDLDPRGQEFDRRRELVELRRLLVDLATLFGRDRPGFVDRTTEYVHDAPEGRGADRHLDAGAGRVDRHAAAQAVGRAHCDGAHDPVAELLLDLEGQALLGERITALAERERVVDLGHRVARKLDVDDRADALNDLTLCHVSLPVPWILFRRIRPPRRR